ncbi:Uncharacterized protein FWK35_00038407, partial [Aphis craccivora]
MDCKTQSQFTVAHMLSERHDNNSISHWLTEWTRNKIILPKIVVTDQSKALMMAVIKSFTQYSSLSKYLSICSSLLLKKSEVEIPHCMLRNDFNHTMKLLSSWPEIKNSSYRIKNFYLRSIGLVIASKDFNDIKYLLECIFTVALNEEDGYVSNNIPNACEIAKNYLKQRILSHLVINQETVYSSDENNIEGQDTELDSDHLLNELGDENSIFKIIQNVYNNCLEESHSHKNQGNHDNMQYCPMIAKKLLQFSKLIPCWSAVMVSIFKYGGITETSASSESLFNDLKNRTFKHKTLPLRVDDFIQIHIDILGSMKIVGAKQNTDTENRNNIENKGDEIKKDKLFDPIQDLSVHCEQIEKSVLLNEKVQYNEI